MTSPVRFATLFLMLLVGVLLTATTALAQSPTPLTTIEDASGDVVLESYDDGALLAPEASSGAGAIPAEGQGTRMMWYPGKSAFRAGRVTGGEWDDGNIGFRSAAFGRNTTASGRVFPESHRPGPDVAIVPLVAVHFPGAEGGLIGVPHHPHARA